MPPSLTPWPTPTPDSSSTATSNRRISSSRRTAAPSSWISGSASTRRGRAVPQLGIISGTPAYMAPEQVAGAAHRIDGRTDIYSLGVVFYQMLCGHLPFRASNTRELLRQVSDDEPQPPRQLRPEIPPELERACLKSLAKRLQDRYTTASDFAVDLRRVGLPAEGQASSQWLGTPSTIVPTGETLASRVRFIAVIVDSDILQRPRPRCRAPPGDRSRVRLRPI